MYATYMRVQLHRLGAAVGSKTKQVFWVLLVAALLRCVLAVVVSHTWDTQTLWNVFPDLLREDGFFASLQEPYDQMRELSLMARAEQKGLFYEYWAYPPGMLYVFYPLAKLYGLFDPSASGIIHGPYSIVIMDLPVGFLLTAKLPNIAADLLIGGLLWRMIGRKGAIWYLFNPYVLLMGAWVFDGVMVALIILAIYWQERGKTALAAASLAAGAAVKFVPLFLVPAFVIYLMRKPYARVREVLVFVGTFALGLFLLVLPVLSGLSTVLDFHSQRYGGGITWQTAVHALAANDQSVDWAPFFLVSLGEVGNLLLPLGILWGSVYLYRKRLTLVQLCLGMMLVYLVSTKLVNEVYLLPLVALATIEIARRPSEAKMLFRWLFWLVPLLWTIVNVPLQGFLAGFAIHVGWIELNQAKLFYAAHLEGINVLLVGLGVAGVVMTLVYLVAIPVFTKEQEIDIGPTKQDTYPRHWHRGHPRHHGVGALPRCSSHGATRQRHQRRPLWFLRVERR